jgi:hypothetical protein
MNPYVAEVRLLNNYQLHLTFENGEERIFDAVPYLNQGIFKQLKEPNLFATAHVVAGSIEWDNEIDLSYDTLYSGSRSGKVQFNF